MKMHPIKFRRFTMGDSVYIEAKRHKKMQYIKLDYQEYRYNSPSNYSVPAIQERMAITRLMRFFT